MTMTMILLLWRKTPGYCLIVDQSVTDVYSPREGDSGQVNNSPAVAMDEDGRVQEMIIISNEEEACDTDDDDMEEENDFFGLRNIEKDDMKVLFSS